MSVLAPFSIAHRPGCSHLNHPVKCLFVAVDRAW